MAEKKEIALVKSPSSTLKNDDINNKKSNNSRERASSLLKAAMAPSKSSSSSTISSLKGLKSKGFLKQALKLKLYWRFRAILVGSIVLSITWKMFQSYLSHFKGVFSFLSLRA